MFVRVSTFQGIFSSVKFAAFYTSLYQFLASPLFFVRVQLCLPHLLGEWCKSTYISRKILFRQVCRVTRPLLSIFSFFFFEYSRAHLIYWEIFSTSIYIWRDILFRQFCSVPHHLLLILVFFPSTAVPIVIFGRMFLRVSTFRGIFHSVKFAAFYAILCQFLASPLFFVYGCAYLIYWENNVRVPTFRGKFYSVKFAVIHTICYTTTAMFSLFAVVVLVWTHLTVSAGVELNSQRWSVSI